MIKHSEHSNWFLDPWSSSSNIAQFSSVTQLCPTLCDPMNRSMPGLPVHHQLPEFTQTHKVNIRRGNGTPLQYFCLENPMDVGTWWAAIYGVTQSQTRLKRLSSSSSSKVNIPNLPFYKGCGLLKLPICHIISVISNIFINTEILIWLMKVICQSVRIMITGFLIPSNFYFHIYRNS